MTFGDFNDFIGSSKFDTLQPHIVLTKREVLAHFRSVLHEDQIASRSSKAVGPDNALNLTARAVIAVFVNNEVTSVKEKAVKA